MGKELVMEALTTERLWTIEDVSAYLVVPVGTLYQWRVRGEGPPCRRLGKHLRYEPAVVREWFASETS